MAGAVSGSELRPGECEGGGGAWHTQGVGAPRLGPLGGQLPRMHHGYGARAARVRRRDIADVAQSPGPPWGAEPLGRV
jgi:hypothetical protein